MMNDGDWMCPDESCANINFARRLTCNRCSKERVDKPSSKKLGTEIGKSAADKSRGLFSADDWQCSKCANVNWARRQTCNVCNAPKFGEVEARTGYGGGYNERGTVEYRPRHDSDEDEYDEFGRRKKRKTSHEKRAAAKDDVKAVNSGKEDVVKEDEDEEESGDEGDLSKYDLWGSGDEDNGKDAEKETTTASAEPPSDPTKRTSPPPVSAATKRAASCGSGSASSRRSSSSSSSSSTSSPARNQPKNKYDDFNLNSEQSRAGSPEISPARYKAPKPERERHLRKSRSRSPITSKKDSGSSHRGNRSKEYIRRDSRDGRRRERDDRRHHASRSGEHSGRGSSNYGRGRAR